MCCDLLKNSYLCLLNNTKGGNGMSYDMLWFAEKFVSLLIEQHLFRGLDLRGKVVICWKIRIFAYWTTPHAAGDRPGGQLWFAEKFVSLLIEQHLAVSRERFRLGCDLLKNSYLCLLNNTAKSYPALYLEVVICWKIRIFAYWTTPHSRNTTHSQKLWFAEKFVSLLIEQHLIRFRDNLFAVVICWKIRIFAYWTTPLENDVFTLFCCDLLKNSYLCLLNNTYHHQESQDFSVVICWKIRIFAYWTTPTNLVASILNALWFAEKFVSLLIEQHLFNFVSLFHFRCDLLKNSYLCLLNNTCSFQVLFCFVVVICWKIRIFAYWTTPMLLARKDSSRCDLLKNSYLCLLNNTKIHRIHIQCLLWFAEKFVSLLIEQHHDGHRQAKICSCDLLKNSYLCLLNNTQSKSASLRSSVVICWKIRIFAYWTTPHTKAVKFGLSCDLLKNSYLCLLNNTRVAIINHEWSVVICWKIRIFAYWTTPVGKSTSCRY